MTQLNALSSNRTSNPYVAGGNDFSKFVPTEKPTADWGIKTFTPADNAQDFLARAKQVSAFTPRPTPVMQRTAYVPAQEILATTEPVASQPKTFNVFGKTLTMPEVNLLKVPNFKMPEINMPTISFGKKQDTSELTA